MRKSEIVRKTKETEIELKLTIEGTGVCKIDLSVGFLNHMLETLTKHSGFNLRGMIKGDIVVDQHHTVEDTGYCLGAVLHKALGDKEGINRAGFFIHPMDEALAMVAIDISGRPLLRFSGNFRTEKIGDLRTDVIQDFFAGFVNGCQCTLHIKLISGRSDHHKVEAVFKAFARALREACMISKRIRDIPSTKGVI
ncbi:MAG: imidazoleglycerol-phosphate dehydratase HisB [candidate division WOR-3 bacterium]